MAPILRRSTILLIILLYTTLSLYQLRLPGLHYDEAFEAVPAMQLWQGQPVSLFRGSGLKVGRQTLPLMTQDYIGAINTYLALPFIALLGPTPAALRTMSILVGAISLWFTYLLAWQLTGQAWVGLLAALLLAVDPTFVFWNRQGIFVTAITAPIGLAATCCWLRRLSHAGQVDNLPSPQWTSWRVVLPRVLKQPWSLLGAFLFGLGLYAKFLFIWFIAALAGALILLNLGRLRKSGLNPVRELDPTEIWLAGLAFLSGCAPLLIYNLQTGGTWLNISQHALTSYYGVNNLALASNLIRRLGQLVIFSSDGHLWYLGQVINNFWEPVLLGLVVVIMGIITTRKNQRAKIQLDTQRLAMPLSPLKAAFLPFLIIGLVTVASIATVSDLWITHFAILMPWLALALAVGSWYICSYPWAHRLKIVLWAALVLLLAANLTNTLRYHLALAKSGGLSGHSDAIYDLSDWLDRHGQGPVAAMDWGLAAPVTYLTAGRVMPTEIFGYGWQSDVQLRQWLESYITQPATLYLWRAPDEIIFDRSSDFKALYRPKNLEETIEEAFYERSGRPLLGVTRLVKKGTAANPPK